MTARHDLALTEDAILDRLKVYARDELEIPDAVVDPVGPATLLIEGLELDSLRQAMLLALIEEDYGVRLDGIDTGEFVALASVGDLVRLIQQHAGRPEAV